MWQRCTYRACCKIDPKINFTPACGSDAAISPNILCGVSSAWRFCNSPYSYSYATSTHLAAGAASCGSGGRVLDAGRGARVGDPGSTPLHQPQGPGAYRIDPGIVTVRCVWIRGSCRLDPQGRRSGVRSPGAEGERRCGRAGGGGTGVRSPPVVVEPGFAHPGQRVSGGAAGLVVVEPGFAHHRWWWNRGSLTTGGSGTGVRSPPVG